MLKIKKLNNNSGIILLTVIMLTILLSIVAISIMSVHVSHKRSTKSVVDRVKAEQLAIGVWMQYQQMRNEGCVAASCGVPGDCTSCVLGGAETIDGKTFTIAIDDTAGPGSGPNGTDPISVTITY